MGHLGQLVCTSALFCGDDDEGEDGAAPVPVRHPWRRPAAQQRRPSTPQPRAEPQGPAVWSRPGVLVGSRSSCCSSQLWRHRRPPRWTTCRTSSISPAKQSLRKIRGFVSPRWDWGIYVCSSRLFQNFMKWRLRDRSLSYTRHFSAAHVRNKNNHQTLWSKWYYNISMRKQPCTCMCVHAHACSRTHWAWVSLSLILVVWDKCLANAHSARVLTCTMCSVSSCSFTMIHQVTACIMQLFSFHQWDFSRSDTCWWLN